MKPGCLFIPLRFDERARKDFPAGLLQKLEMLLQQLFLSFRGRKFYAAVFGAAVKDPAAGEGNFSFLRKNFFLSADDPSRPDAY